MTTAYVERNWFDVVIGDIVALIKSQPPQVLLSIGSITIVASEASKMMPGPAAMCVAIGAEWAYLRGIASSGKGSKGWTVALNWGALALVVLYGGLWGGREFHAIPAEPTTPVAWLLVAIHILPLAFISFAAAMVHRSAVEAEHAEAAVRQVEEDARQRRLQAEQDALALDTERTRRELEVERTRQALEIERKRQEMALWAEGQQIKASVRQRVTDVSQNSVTASVTNTVTPRQDNVERDVLRARVVAMIRDSQATNTPLVVNKAWQELGLSSRGMWYKLVDEAKAKGEL